ncbi:hypothetical protein SGPA1_50150 [Streptomyces misionensis JCM 4497]
MADRSMSEILDKREGPAPPLGRS